MAILGQGVPVLETSAPTLCTVNLIWFQAVNMEAVIRTTMYLPTPMVNSRSFLWAILAAAIAQARVVKYLTPVTALASHKTAMASNASTFGGTRTTDQHWKDTMFLSLSTTKWITGLKHLPRSDFTVRIQI